MPLRRRPLLRAAAVGAVGYSAAKAGTRSAQAEQQQQAPPEQAPPEAYAPAPQPAPEAAAPQPDRVTQLQQLAQLHDSGALTDAEFEQEKQRILNS